VKEVSLVTLGGGAAVEKFDFELERVLENIQDINCDATAVREVTVKVKIKPDRNREVGSVSVQATAKLAPELPHETPVYFSNKKGVHVAYQNDPKQTEMFSEKDKPDNVTEIKKEQAK